MAMELYANRFKMVKRKTRKFHPISKNLTESPPHILSCPKCTHLQLYPLYDINSYQPTALANRPLHMDVQQVPPTHTGQKWISCQSDSSSLSLLFSASQTEGRQPPPSKVLRWLNSWVLEPNIPGMGWIPQLLLTSCVTRVSDLTCLHFHVLTCRVGIKPPYPVRMFEQVSSCLSGPAGLGPLWSGQAWPWPPSFTHLHFRAANAYYPLHWNSWARSTGAKKQRVPTWQTVRLI